MKVNTLEPLAKLKKTGRGGVPMETDKIQLFGSRLPLRENFRATMTQIHECSSRSGRTSPLFFLLKKKRTLGFCLQEALSIIFLPCCCRAEGAKRGKARSEEVIV